MNAPPRMRLVCDDVSAILARQGKAPVMGGFGLDAAQRLRSESSRIVKTSRRFAFDYDATVAAASSLSNVNVFANAFQRARLPFPRIVLDYDVQGFLDGTPDARAKGPDAPDRTACFIESLGDTRFRVTGFGTAELHDTPHIFFNGISVTCDLAAPIERSPDHGRIQAALYAYARIFGLQTFGEDGTPARLDHDSLASVDYDALLRSCLLGSATQSWQIPGAESSEARRLALHLTDHARYELEPTLAADARMALDAGSRDIAPNVGNAVISFSGQWRMVISLIALINSQEFTVDRAFRASPRSRLINGRITPYLEHRWVSLKVTATTVIREMSRRTVDALPRRRHEVRGHWVHRRGIGDTACQHAFSDITESRQICSLCGYDRWWRPHHERGDASIGYVTKDYIVEGGGT